MRAALPNTLALEEQAEDTTAAGPRQPQVALGEVGEGKRVLGRRVMEIRRQGSALRIAPAVRQLRLEHAGGAGAEEHADAPGAVFVPRRGDGGVEAVLAQRQLGEAVVAAVVVGEIVAHRLPVQTADLADTGSEVRGLEGAGSEAGPLFAQRRQRRPDPRPEAAYQREMAEVRVAARSVRRDMGSKIDDAAAIAPRASPTRHGTDDQPRESSKLPAADAGQFVAPPAAGLPPFVATNRTLQNGVP